MSSARPIVGREEIRIAMLGMVDGNGHPFSWSAIFNGFNPEYMKDCGYPVIPVYLAKQPEVNFGIPGAKVTHVWCDDPKDTEHVAKASLIPNVVQNATDVIGKVDAVVVATDKGFEHVERCRPFIEAGVPVFVDKPLVDNTADLAVFNKWVEEGKPILSSSSLRYSKELLPYRISTDNLGELRWISMTMPKSWERYGIHALEAVYPIIGPGFLTVRNVGDKNQNVAHFTHKCGAHVSIVVIKDMAGGVMEICGNGGCAQASSADSYYSFKKQMEVFVEYLRTGVRPYAWAETDELMRMLIGGIMSREQGGAEIDLNDVHI